jgi:predicted amidohydrolase
MATAIFFPEASDYITSLPSPHLALPPSTSPFVNGLRDAAREHCISISVGVHAPSEDPSDDRVQNLHIWINARGEIEAQYSKLHLFSASIKDGPTIRESNTTQPGTQLLSPISTALGPLGLLICFDLRFPEQSLALRSRGVQILTYPSAFTVPTGEAHWEVLLRARAIETQCWVVAAAQVGVHDNQVGKERRSWGHSLVVDPWGRVVLDMGGEQENGGGVGVEVIDLDLSLVQKARREILLERRVDVYPDIK